MPRIEIFNRQVFLQLVYNWVKLGVFQTWFDLVCWVFFCGNFICEFCIK